MKRFITPLLILLLLTSCNVLTNVFNEIPAVPANFRAYANSQDEMVLTWNTTFAASEYIVYRSLSPSGPYSEIGVTKNLTFYDKTLIEGTVYYYRVAARNTNGSSNQSSYVRSKTPKNGDFSFWAADLTVPGKYYKTWAEKVAVGNYCEIFLEIDGYTSNSPKIDQATINEIRDEFDTYMYPKITDVYGFPWDDSSHGKITLLLLDIQDGYVGPGNPYVAGFFHSKDLFVGLTSNQMDMIYIDTWPANLTTTSG